MNCPRVIARKRTSGIVAALLSATALWAPAAFGQDLAITHATVYASPGSPARQHATVVIQRGVVTEVGKGVHVPQGVEVLDCTGCVVLAGFWNAHVHFTEPKWVDAEHQPAQKLSASLADMLTHSGFTTVVDTGSDGANTIALRRRLQTGEVTGPRILTSGAPIFPAHSLPYYVADLPAEVKAKLGQPATPQEAVACVDANHASGTDIVKLFTGSIVAPNHIVPMKVDIARAAVNEAHRYKQPVFSHSTNLEGTQVAVAAGVDVLAHTPEATEGIDMAFLLRMVAQHMTIIPTLKLFSKDDNIADIRKLAFDFHKQGGRLVYGTDTGFLSDYDQGEEFSQLAKAGFDFQQILAMLTTAPADLFHLEYHEGKVAAGMRGDLTILSRDPAAGDISAFTAVKYTIKAGKVIWRRQ